MRPSQREDDGQVGLPDELLHERDVGQVGRVEGEARRRSLEPRVQSADGQAAAAPGQQERNVEREEPRHAHRPPGPRPTSPASDYAGTAGSGLVAGPARRPSGAAAVAPVATRPAATLSRIATVPR